MDASEDMINFMLQCLNILLFCKTETSLSPEVIFGSTKDSVDIVPNLNHFPDIDSYLKLPNDKITDNAELKSMNSIKKWYCSLPKQVITPILDYYDSENTRIQKYTTIALNNKRDYVLLDINLIPEKKTKDIPHVKSYNLGSNNDTDTKLKRLWFAKFFGIYNRESLGFKLNDKDFGCDDVYSYYYSSDLAYKKDKHDRLLSIRKHSAVALESEKMSRGYCLY